MSNNPEEEEKDRLNSEEFVDLIPHLPFGNLLDIEFFTTDWKRLISTVASSNRIYKCNLCNVIQPGQKSVALHITGKKHVGNMSNVKYFYHPEYTFTKAQLRNDSKQTKDKKSNDTVEKSVASSTKTVTSEKLLDTKGKSSSDNTAANKSKVKNSSEDKDAKVDTTKNKAVTAKDNEKASSKDEQLSVTKNVSKQSDLKNKETVDSQSAEKKMEKNLEENTKLQKTDAQSRKISEDASKNETKSSPSKKSQAQNEVKDSSVTESAEKNTKNNEIKPIVRVVPLAKLQKIPEVKGDQGSTVAVKKDLKSTNTSEKSSDSKSTDQIGKQCATKSTEEKNSETEMAKKSAAAEKTSVENQSIDKSSPKANANEIKNKDPKKTCESNKKTGEILNSKSQISPQNSKVTSPANTESTNVMTKKLEEQTTQGSLKDNNLIKEKEKAGENLMKSSNSNEKSDKTPCLDNNKEASRKFVKNPLAGNKLASIENSQKPSSKNNDNISDVILIEDNEDEAPSTSSKAKNVEEGAIKEPEPPAKKQRVSSSNLLSTISKVSNKKESQIPTISKQPTVLSVANKVVHAKSVTQSRSQMRSPPKNKEKSIDEPAFARKSVTDAISGDKVGGFVGVEYVIKITRGNVPLKYECGLCELVLGGQSMQSHLLGYSHRLKFCEKHFPTAIQQFRQYIVNVPSDEHYKVMIPVLQKLCCAIEEHHGRSLPFDCEERRYSLERHRVLTEVFARRHPSEQRGPTFTHVVDSKQVDEFIRRKDTVKLQPPSNNIVFDITQSGNSVHQNPIPTFSRHLNEPSRRFDQNVLPYGTGMMQMNVTQPFPSNNFIDDETHKRMVDNFLKANNQSGSSQQKSFRSSRNDRDERKSKPLKRSHSPPRANFGFRKDVHPSPNIWTSYCRLVDTNLKALRESFQKYRANPESHPSYKEEWLKFWHRRKAELLAVGRDYRTYDFQPDWVPYFNNRINELYDEAFEKLKVEAREELSLPMTNDYLCDPKYFVHIKTDSDGPAIKKIAPSSNVNISSQAEIGAFSSYNTDRKHAIDSNTLTRQSIGNTQDRTEPYTKEFEIRDESTPTVVSVLRLLTALEEHLGSLGPKIVDLLSKALQAEKTSQGRAHVLLTEDNCTLLETAMEKFKGLVIAGILDAPKERALKKAIAKVDALLEYTKQIKEKHLSFREAEQPRNTLERTAAYVDDKMQNKPQSMQNTNEKLKQALQSVSNANDISKVIHLIEEKISASLKAQGRTDVDRAHLEQLAAVCVLLEKKKREAGTAESQDITAHKPVLQQPLSDTLKKIVSSVSENSDIQRGNREFSGDLNIQNSRMPGYNPGELSNAMNSGNNQGNFSNLYSKNNQQTWMSDNQSRPWQQQLQHPQQQQQQPNLGNSFGWAQYPNRAWGASEASSSSGSNSQRAGYNNNLPLKPPGQSQFRYN